MPEKSLDDYCRAPKKSDQESPLLIPKIFDKNKGELRVSKEQTLEYVKAIMGILIALGVIDSGNVDAGYLDNIAGAIVLVWSIIGYLRRQREAKG